jgi:hypothetical protein
MESKIKRVPKLNGIKNEKIRTTVFSEQKKGKVPPIDSVMHNLFNEAFSIKQNQMTNKRKVPLMEDVISKDGA